MKKNISIFILSFLCLSLVGCKDAAAEKRILVLEDNVKVLKEENALLKKENTTLKTEKDNLSSKNTILTNSNEKLNKEIDELKNGAEYLIIKLRTANENKNLEEVEKIANELNSRFRGTKEDIEGQKTLKSLQEQISKEKQKEEEEKSKTQKQKLNEIIKLNGVRIDDINSAGGVDVSISFTNKSDKPIKYVNFSVVGYNAVGDRIQSEIGGKEIAYLQTVGPYAKNEGSNTYQGYNYWEAIWYNSTIKKIEVIGITIDYMDGTKIVLTEEDCKLLM